MITTKDYIVAMNAGCRAEVNDYVVCVAGHLKYYTEGEIYLVKKTKERTNYLYNTFLMLEGFNTFVISNNFKLIDKKEHSAQYRKLSIAEVTGDNVITTDKPIGRKIDKLENKNNLLFEMMLYCLTSKKSNSFKSFKSVVGNIVKNDKVYDVKESDFNDIANMNLKDIIDAYQKK